jgi:hypothetical protein
MVDTRRRRRGNRGLRRSHEGNVSAAPDRWEGTVAGDGIQQLRDKRGDQGVTFADVADHLEDFVLRRPETRETINELASFLAQVEDLDHEHEDDEGPALT